MNRWIARSVIGGTLVMGALAAGCATDSYYNDTKSDLLAKLPDNQLDRKGMQSMTNQRLSWLVESCSDPILYPYCPGWDMASAARRKQAAYNLALSRSDSKEIADIENWARNSSVNLEATFLVVSHGAEEKTRQRDASQEDARQTSSGEVLGKGVALAGIGALLATAADSGVVTDDLTRIGAAAVAGIVGEAGGTNTQNAVSGPSMDGLANTLASSGRSGAGDGRCEIPGYPDEPDKFDTANWGVSWCASSVSIQRRAFAAQAALIKCSLTGPDSEQMTIDQVTEVRRRVSDVCRQLDFLGQRARASDCNCPRGYGGD